MKLQADEFHMLRDYINEKTGIFLRDEKAYFLENRLESRFQEIHCDNIQEYYHLLKYDSSGSEMDTLTELLTTNETFFFRDSKQLYTFSQEALTQVVNNKREKGKRTLTIWSAGCSTGEEPYTLAMMAQEAARGMTIRIIATDINSKVLDIARQGIYYGRSLKDVPPQYLERYFIRSEKGFEVVPDIKNMVEFMQLNLVDRVRMRLLNDLDFIFCRNVLIYFSAPVAKQVINCFYDSLNKGGYIFLGLAESMHLFSGAFKLVKFKELFGYMKE